MTILHLQILVKGHSTLFGYKIFKNEKTKTKQPSQIMNENNRKPLMNMKCQDIYRILKCFIKIVSLSEQRQPVFKAHEEAEGKGEKENEPPVTVDLL